MRCNSCRSQGNDGIMWNLLPTLLHPTRRSQTRLGRKLFFLYRTYKNCILMIWIRRINIFPQLSILNAASIFGRVIPGLYTRSVGITNMLLFVGAACGVLNLAMIGVKTVAGFTIFAILYGFFSGACKRSIHYVRDEQSDLGRLSRCVNYDADDGFTRRSSF